ncbi:ABC transporter ATP-binding protein/permease [Sphingomonas psychrotolerans]|uniref:ABC transporter ATP-binding protein/permease n=1 Tax=Sphingomonas psychrotolerans TaxID=1327635 RepID=A0ABU3N5G1_9SPHN|nr:ABC transporter ATP-binding protein [Sphingomonas psychrotolerans]MDT8759754.1 ABC transporter ATP-binding protein/permease [Sphingomonas psychrotolerans]
MPILLAVAGTAAEGVGLMLLAPMIGVLALSTGNKAASGGYAGMLASHLPAGKAAQTLILILMFGVVMVLRSVLVVARDISLARLHAAFLERTRMSVLERVAGAGWNKIASLQHGRVSHLLSADFHAFTLAGTSLINLCLSAIMLAMLIAVAFTLSPMLAATMSLFLASLAAILYPTLSIARRSGAGLADLGQRMTSDLGQFLAGLKPALASNLEAEFVAHIRRLQQDQVRQLVSFARKQSEARATTLLAAGMAAAVALSVGGVVLGVAAPELLAMLVVLARMGGPCLQFQQSLQLLHHNLPIYTRIKQLERELHCNSESALPPSPPPSAGTISLAAITYLHQDGGGGVRDLHLTIPRGAFVAIVGGSGSGKTTLADLLAGLLVPQAGEIRIGGTLLTPANAAAWRDVISYLPQDPFLINDTVRRNLLWGNEQADDAALPAALHIVAADGVVNARPEGLDTLVGERGILLSGGERQRIALGRALLRRPRLMILDEATNALDCDTERRVLSNLAALQDRPTIVAISHRAEVLDLFDEVYRMEAGRLD